MSDELIQLGIDTGDGVFRFMNNEELYKRTLIDPAKTAGETWTAAKLDDRDYDKDIEKLRCFKSV